MRVSPTKNREETNHPMDSAPWGTLTVGYAFQGSSLSARQIERLAGHYMAVLKVLAQAPAGNARAVEVLKRPSARAEPLGRHPEQRYVEVVAPVDRTAEWCGRRRRRWCSARRR